MEPWNSYQKFFKLSKKGTNHRASPWHISYLNRNLYFFFSSISSMPKCHWTLCSCPRSNATGPHALVHAQMPLDPMLLSMPKCHWTCPCSNATVLSMLKCHWTLCFRPCPNATGLVHAQMPLDTSMHTPLDDCATIMLTCHWWPIGECVAWKALLTWTPRFSLEVDPPSGKNEATGPTFCHSP